ncbi:hypothetical protein FOMG_17987 [Fusarium oxysporum f. sp. melonis 26406]|uniref:O-methyltransferase C-terminal domain-containing protein n=1 Tax=Fusarium oxysporum f. sp. melonis 26406 TaxID=1089452 RepID=W9Z0M9_FUSOX|nr:hypothetical protein FOMG_17987 [Fusarium oxysporum f. sp. melonis 26406]
MSDTSVPGTNGVKKIVIRVLSSDQKGSLETTEVFVESGNSNASEHASESVTTLETNGADKFSDEDVSIALKAANVNAVPGLIDEIKALNKTFDRDDQEARLKLMAKAKSLWQSLETPRETMLRHCWAEPSLHCALTAGTSKDLWTYLVKLDGPFKVADVAKAKNMEPALLARLLRHISSMGYLTEVGFDTYELENFTKSMAFTFINSGYPCISGACINALGKFHEWADLNSWKDPTDIANSPLQLGYKTQKTFFEHLHASPHYGQMFHLHMGGYRQGRPSWMDADFFPVREKLLDGFEQSDDAALLLDIGGSFGHDIGEFNRKFPNAPGRLILQDLPVVIDQITRLDAKIERTPLINYSNCLTGARAYYMHSVLHDWSDETCLKILTTVMGAMKPGYSKLLINENVIPSTGAQWEATALDVMMLTLLASRERTEENWQSLLGKAGLKITKIWTVANGVESLIESELA